MWRKQQIGNYEHVCFSEVFHRGAASFRSASPQSRTAVVFCLAALSRKWSRLRARTHLHPCWAFILAYIAGRGLKLLWLAIQCLEESCEDFNIHVDQYLSTDPWKSQLLAVPHTLYDGAIWFGKPERKNYQLDLEHDMQTSNYSTGTAYSWLKLNPRGSIGAKYFHPSPVYGWSGHNWPLLDKPIGQPKNSFWWHCTMECLQRSPSSLQMLRDTNYTSCKHRIPLNVGGDIIHRLHEKHGCILQAAQKESWGYHTVGKNLCLPSYYL